MISSVSRQDLENSNNVWYWMLYKEFATASVLQIMGEEFTEKRLAWAVREVQLGEPSMLLRDDKDADIFYDNWEKFMRKGDVQRGQVKIGSYARQFFTKRKTGYDRTEFYIMHASDKDFVPIYILVIHFNDTQKYSNVDAIWRSAWGSLCGYDEMMRGKAFKLIQRALSENKHINKVYVRAETPGSRKMYERNYITLNDEGRGHKPERYWFANPEASTEDVKRRKIGDTCVLCNKPTDQMCSDCGVTYCGARCYDKDHDFCDIGKRAPLRTKAQRRKFSKVMREFKRGTLRSSSGKRVTSRRQALAIAFSEARRK